LFLAENLRWALRRGGDLSEIRTRHLDRIAGLPGWWTLPGLMDSARTARRGGGAEMLDGAAAHSPLDRRAADAAKWNGRHGRARAFHSAAQPFWFRIPEP
jgi:hypothetical protein